MMNSNPDDNNPNDDRNRPIAGNESLDRKIKAGSQRIVIGNHDVLSGRSKSSYNHCMCRHVLAFGC